MKESTHYLLPISDGEDKSCCLTNRMRKNYRHIRKWAKRNRTNCFRIYDREIRQYPAAIDYYAGKFCIHYFSPSREKSDPPQALKLEIERSLKVVFGVDSDAIYWRTRAKKKETRQYEKAGASCNFFIVEEYGLKFKINLEDYLDTGLFLDHRETRRLAASYSVGKKVLNLFAYTCSFSIHAAAAGAELTKSVDMSNTYTQWAKENFVLNSLSLNQNEVIRADCLKFLADEVKKGCKYDLIIIDPPTISRSKKMDSLFEIQKDYAALIHQSIQLLGEEGLILFSTNSRKFTFDYQLFPSCLIEEISAKTIPLDFHDPRIHRCWKISNLRNGKKLDT